MRILAGLGLLLSGASQAEVVDVSPQGFTSQHALVMSAPADRVYTALTEEVSAWWDASHSYGGDAAAFSIQDTAGGCFCEKLPAGGAVEHMRVVQAQPGRMLVMHGGLGPLQSMGVAGAMTFSLRAHPEGTVLEYRYVVGGYVQGGLAPLAGPVDQVQLGQLKRLQQYVNTGAALNP